MPYSFLCTTSKAAVDVTRTAHRECLNHTKANSASSKLGVHCVQPRAAHGSHTSFAAARSGFTFRVPVEGVRPQRAVPTTADHTFHT